MLEVGKPAPDFTLEETTGSTVSLADLRGKWVVLYFYPKDNTKGCTQEACDFRDNHQALLDKGAVVYGVSPDPLKSHVKFTEKHDLPFPLLSDPETKMLEDYGVWQEKKMYGKTYMGVVRTTVIIDPEGIVRHVWEKVKVKEHVPAVIARLDELQGAA